MYGPIGPPKPSIQQTAENAAKIGCQKAFPHGGRRINYSFPSISKSLTSSRSSHFLSYSCAISSVGCIRSGTITVTQPAARPRATPVKAVLQHQAVMRVKCSFFAATKKVSGAGLLWATSVPETTSWKYRAVPVVCKFHLDHIPRARAGHNARQAHVLQRGQQLPSVPFLQGTPRAKHSSASCQILSSTFCGSPGMYSATWRRRLSPARPRPPALNFSISAGSGRPSAAHAGSHRVSHRRSVSTSARPYQK